MVGDKAVGRRKDEGGVRTDPVLLALAGSSEQEMQVVTDLLAAVIRYRLPFPFGVSVSPL